MAVLAFWIFGMVAFAACAIAIGCYRILFAAPADVWPVREYRRDEFHGVDLLDPWP